MIELTKVDCNGCTACCRHGVVVLHPALGDNPLDYNTQEIPGVGMALKRNRDGSCHYLTDKGCSIWPKTPAVCRAFDCRAYVRSAWAAFDPLVDRDVLAAGFARLD
jgi:Fe-S-cluster containining protein